ncbi:MAG: hypothetical protein II127_07220, partial [Ruminococcus sp.]|nr:hypothetical protein [Ruminococcus sp.]
DGARRRPCPPQAGKNSPGGLFLGREQKEVDRRQVDAKSEKEVLASRTHVIRSNPENQTRRTVAAPEKLSVRDTFFDDAGSSPFCCIFVHIQRNPLLPLLHIRIIKKDKLSLFTKTFLLYCAVSKLIKHVFFVMIRMYKQAGMVCLVILFRSEKFE